MGAFDANRKDVITIRADWWDEHESVEARTIVRSGDEEWVLNQQMLIQARQGGNRQQRRAGGFRREKDAEIEFKNQMGATRRLWIQKMLEGWTFTMGGRPMPFVKSGQNEVDDGRMAKVMRLLDQTYIDFIYEAIMAAQPKQAQPEEVDEDDEEDEEEGSLFFEDASNSTDGDTFTAEERLDMARQSLMNLVEPTNRNFLSRS